MALARQAALAAEERARRNASAFFVADCASQLLYRRDKTRE